MAGVRRQLAIGFNRRWSPAVLAAQRALAGTTTPKLVVYRVAAGPVPDGHWYHDRRQGGRLLGEVCHFVDTAQALVGAPIEDVTGLPGGGGPGGQHGTTPWSRCGSRTGPWPRSPTAAPRPWPARNGSRSRPGHAGWSSTTSARFRPDGKTVWKGRQDKGHHAEAAAFRQAIAGGPALPTEAMLATMRATIQAARGRAAVTDQATAHPEQVQAAVRREGGELAGEVRSATAGWPGG